MTWLKIFKCAFFFPPHLLVCLKPVWTSRSLTNSALVMFLLHKDKQPLGFLQWFQTGLVPNCRDDPLWRNGLSNHRKDALKHISRFTDHLQLMMIGGSCPLFDTWCTDHHKTCCCCVLLSRLFCRFLRLSVCRGVPLSERGGLRAHQRTVLLQDGLHRTELRAKWVPARPYCC